MVLLKPRLSGSSQGVPNVNISGKGDGSNCADLVSSMSGVLTTSALGCAIVSLTVGVRVGHKLRMLTVLPSFMQLFLILMLFVNVKFRQD